MNRFSCRSDGGKIRAVGTICHISRQSYLDSVSSAAEKSAAGSNKLEEVLMVSKQAVFILEEPRRGLSHRSCCTLLFSENCVIDVALLMLRVTASSKQRSRCKVLLLPPSDIGAEGRRVHSAVCFATRKRPPHCISQVAPQHRNTMTMRGLLAPWSAGRVPSPPGRVKRPQPFFHLRFRKCRSRVWTNLKFVGGPERS